MKPVPQPDYAQLYFKLLYFKLSYRVSGMTLPPQGVSWLAMQIASEVRKVT